MTDTPTAVQNGVEAYAAAEASLEAAHAALLLLPATYRSLYVNGTIGYLEANERGSAAMALAGQVSLGLNAVYQNHQKDTARATALGIDLPPPPATLAAGTIRPDGGGR
jgi:hypothetical protein